MTKTRHTGGSPGRDRARGFDCPTPGPLQRQRKPPFLSGCQARPRPGQRRATVGCEFVVVDATSVLLRQTLLAGAARGLMELSSLAWPKVASKPEATRYADHFSLRRTSS